MNAGSLLQMSLHPPYLRQQNSQYEINVTDFKSKWTKGVQIKF